MSFVPKLADFAGEWQIDRQIDDRLSGGAGRFEGQGWFRPLTERDSLAYREEGKLRLGDGPAVAAIRDYVWWQAAGRIFVDYRDGRAFHDFDPADPQAVHWCDPDEYRVRYAFDHWPVWSADWTVLGPRKDYRMQSTFRRA